MSRLAIAVERQEWTVVALYLLQGGGVKLHVDYVDLIYRTLHDLGESPRTAFGENRAGLSGVALNVEMDPLLKKVQRKRLVRSAA